MNSTLKSTVPLQTVMTVAGSDSGGGAGIQADLKTFAALGTFGTSVLTAITAQNPQKVTAVEVLTPELTAHQIEAIGEYFMVGAVKTGMLASQDMVMAVAEALRNLPLQAGKGLPPLVVDPVMVAASGARLLDDDALIAIEKYLIPMATIITPNLDEAAILAQREDNPLNNKQDMEAAAGVIQQRFGVPVLVKGGHLAKRGSTEELTNCLFDGHNTHWISHARITGVNTHGSGCTLSAAISVELMRGNLLLKAVSGALNYLHGALEHAIVLGGEGVGEKFINHQYKPLKMA